MRKNNSILLKISVKYMMDPDSNISEKQHLKQHSFVIDLKPTRTSADQQVKFILQSIHQNRKVNESA